MRPERPRYILDMWHRCVKRSRFVFFFFFFFFSFLHGWILEMGISGKERAIDQPYLSPVHTWTRVWLPTSHNQCVALEWLLVRNESNAFRMPREYRRLDQPSPPPPPFFPLSFPEHDPSLNVVVARYLRFVLKPRLSVNVERPGSSLND